MRAPDIRETNITEVVKSVRQLARGRSNAAGTVTLTTSAATTTVTNPAVSSACFPILSPASANGATEMGNGTCYVSTVSDGSFVITHANNTTASRTLHWHAIGG